MNQNGVAQMKVIHLTNVVAPDKLGGLERYVRELAQAQVADGLEVVVMSKGVGPEILPWELGADGVTVRRYEPPQKASRLFALKYPFVVMNAVRSALGAEADRRDLRSGRIIVHAHFPVPALALVVLRIPYQYTFHAPVYKEIVGERQGSYSLPGPAERLAVAGMKAVESLVLRKASHVLTLSAFISREAQALGAPIDKINVIPGGLNRDRFFVQSSTNPTGEGSIRIFCARRLVERTGVEALVAAMAEVHVAFPAAVLRIAGSGPREGSVRRLIKELDLEEVVVLLGRVSEEQLVSEYSEATLSVTPTLYLEGFGLSTAESLAVGTPALVTPVGANPELVSGLSPSLISSGPEPADLAASLIRLLNDQSGLASIRRHLKAGYADKWTWSSVVTQINAVYRDAP